MDRRAAAPCARTWCLALAGAVLVCAWSLAAAAPRPITLRGPLTPDERVTIDIFERSRRSVVDSSTAGRVRDRGRKTCHGGT